jgi:hypothetical protein
MVGRGGEKSFQHGLRGLTHGLAPSAVSAAGTDWPRRGGRSIGFLALLAVKILPKALWATIMPDHYPGAGTSNQLREAPAIPQGTSPAELSTRTTADCSA